MAFYRNNTRFVSIVTIKISLVPNPSKTLAIGLPSAMSTTGLELGIHDLLVGPGESIELEKDVEADFIAVRGTA